MFPVSNTRTETLAFVVLVFWGKMGLMISVILYFVSQDSEITIDFGSLFALSHLLSHFPRSSIMTQLATTFLFPFIYPNFYSLQFTLF